MTTSPDQEIGSASLMEVASHEVASPPQSLHPSVVLADGGSPAVLAFAPLSVVLADAGAPAVLAFAPASVVLDCQ